MPTNWALANDETPYVLEHINIYLLTRYERPCNFVPPWAKSEGGFKTYSTYTNMSSFKRQCRQWMWQGLIDWCCFYYFVRNSLVALLEASCARNLFFRFVHRGMNTLGSTLLSSKNPRNFQKSRDFLKALSWGFTFHGSFSKRAVQICQPRRFHRTEEVSNNFFVSGHVNM